MQGCPRGCTTLPGSDKSVVVCGACRCCCRLAVLGWPPLEGRLGCLLAFRPPSCPARCSHPSLPHYNPLFKSQFSAPRLDMPLPHCTLPHCIPPHLQALPSRCCSSPTRPPASCWVSAQHFVFCHTGFENDDLSGELSAPRALSLPAGERVRTARGCQAHCKREAGWELTWPGVHAAALPSSAQARTMGSLPCVYVCRRLCPAL